MRQDLTNDEQEKINQELLGAARNGNAKICQDLINKGADLNVRDRSLRTALHLAAAYNHRDVCLILIDNMNDVNPGDSVGARPLHFAAGRDNSTICQALINKGADVNVQDGFGCTALHYAANTNNGNLKICKFLIDNGADVNVQDSSNSTALHMAIERNSTPTCLMLIANMNDVNLRKRGSMTPLHLAAKKGNFEVCQALINNGADLNLIGNFRCTALRAAMAKNNLKLASYLISEGANIFDNLTNSIPESLKNEASALYDAKCQKEMLIINNIKTNLAVSVPITYSRTNDLINIFTAIKHEIRVGYFKVTQIEKLFEIFGSYLKKIENGELGTTRIFQYHLKKHFQEITEPLIKNKIVNIIGRNLDNFRYDHVNKGQPIPGGPLGHVASFFDLSELGALNALSLTEGYQLARDELRSYRKKLSEKIGSGEIIVSNSFRNNVIIPMGERQDLFPNILANNHLQREKQRAKNRDADFEVIDHDVEKRIETEAQKDIERAQEAKIEGKVRAQKIARLSEAVIKAFQNDSLEDTIFLDLVARDKSIREDIYAQISTIAAEGELTDVQVSLSKWQQICASSADPTTPKEQPRSQVTENDQAEIEDSGGDRMVDAVNREKPSSSKESLDL